MGGPVPAPHDRPRPRPSGCSALVLRLLQPPQTAQQRQLAEPDRLREPNRRPAGRGLREALHDSGGSPRPGFRSTSPTHRARGSAARTRTPTGCYGSTSPKAPTWPDGRKKRSRLVAATLNNTPRKTLGWKNLPKLSTSTYCHFTKP